jgi:hypothetical protein
MMLLPNGQVLAAGGDGFLTSAELYNPATGTWTATDSMPVGNDLTWASTGNMKVSGLDETVTVLLNGQVLFAGGETFDKARGALPSLQMPNCTSRKLVSSAFH